MLIMNGRQTTTSAARDRAATATRRQLLTAAGVVAVGSMSGCLGRVASATTDTGSSPAAFYSGDASGVEGAEPRRIYGAAGSDIRYVPATVRGSSGPLSGEVELEGWATSTTTTAGDYNSSRSNKPSSEWWSDPDSDGDGVDDDLLLAALDTEGRLLSHVETAQDGVASRSKADAKKALEGFVAAATEALAEGSELDRCSGDVCRAVRENVEKCRQLAREAGEAVDAESWNDASSLLGDIEGIVARDIERLEGALGAETVEAVAALRSYLDGEPTIGEQFAVCLPDASLPGGRGSLAEELTPQRLVNYLVGRRGAESCGELDQARAVGIHPDISCRRLLSTRLSRQGRQKRGVAAFIDGDAVCVAGAPADLDGAEPMLAAGHDKSTPKLYQGLAKAPDSLDDWGEETTDEGVAVTPTLIMPVLAQPEDCPSPIPALLYVRRCKHDDQYIYCGGWVVDDGALYRRAATLLVCDGPTEVVAVSPDEVASDRYGAIVADKCERERCRYGSTLFAGAPDPDADYLPAAFRSSTGGKKGYDYYSKVSGAPAGDDADGGETSVVMALDAPVVHLATTAGNDTKFKSGAELSKSVN